ncbi:adenosine kinase-like [Sitophilus oryzae]|uniref:Adenosine kinase n=1 Tax=Sitophilus oryzae TaxID=7048 RepID=A0A6J2Y3M9_SITOR|nr:adenosine kinase-like [Sitophilus oryzae]
MKEMLICFGSPLIDVIVKVSNGFLNRYNIQPDQTISADSSYKAIFQHILKLNPKYLPGGSVTNTARVIKWISRSSNIFYVGAIGNDTFGSLIKNKLESEHIDCYLPIVDDIDTGKCAVFISGNGQHRSLITNLGASQLFSVKELSSNKLRETIESSLFLYISALFLSVSIEVTKNVVEEFKKLNKKIIINLGADFVINKYPDLVSYLYKNSHVVVGNEKEFLCFARNNKATLEGKTLDDIIIDTDSIFSTNSDRLLLVTRGYESVLTYENKLIRYFDVEPVENIVDTNGAGDAFIGGFLAKYIENAELDTCVKCGIWCAREIVQCVGCDFNSQVSYNNI